MADAKELILNRRARFLAASLTGLAALTSTAHATEAVRPHPELPPSARIALTEPGGCYTNEGVGPAFTEIARQVEEARALLKKGDKDGARAVLKRARQQYLVADVLELESEIALDAGRIAHARALLEQRAQCSEKVPESVAQRLEDLRARTAQLTIESARRVRIDGIDIGNGATSLFLEPGSYAIEIETFDGVTTKRDLAFAGGEQERIELPNGEPRVCLSIAMPHNDREEAGPIGITVAPSMLIDLAPPDGGPLTVGGQIAPFGRVALSRSSEVRIGASLAPSGSSRGFTMPVGGFTSFRFYPGHIIAIGVGAAGGYLVAPSPSRATIGSFEAAPSAFVEPHIPITVSFGAIEIEHKIGMIICEQADAERDRFAPSFVSLSLGITWLPLRHNRFED